MTSVSPPWLRVFLLCILAAVWTGLIPSLQAYIAKSSSQIDTLVGTCPGTYSLTSGRCTDIGNTVKACLPQSWNTLYALFQLNGTTGEKNFAATLFTAGEWNQIPLVGVGFWDTVLGYPANSSPGSTYVIPVVDPATKIPYQVPWSALPSGGSGSSLTPTAVKTSNYTAAANEFVPVDVGSGVGNATVTFPTAPADKTLVGVKLIATTGTNAAVCTLGGSDVFNVAGGPTTKTLKVLNQSAVFQYKSSSAIWYLTSSDVPLDHGTEVALAGGTALALSYSYSDNLTANRTLTFTGTPSAALQPTVLRLTVTGGPWTLTIPTSSRIGDAGTTTSLVLQNGNHELSWIYAQSKHWLADSAGIAPQTGDIAMGLVAQGLMSGSPTLDAAKVVNDGVHPYTLIAKSVTVLTAGTPADIATITLPAGISRWHIISGSTGSVLAESAAGTLAGASFTIYDAAAAGGTQMSAAFAGPANTTSLVPIVANSLATFSTSSTAVIRQTAVSANAGSMSFYILAYPIP